MQKALQSAVASGSSLMAMALSQLSDGKTQPDAWWQPWRLVFPWEWWCQLIGKKSKLEKVIWWEDLVILWLWSLVEIIVVECFCWQDENTVFNHSDVTTPATPPFPLQHSISCKWTCQQKVYRSHSLQALWKTISLSFFHAFLQQTMAEWEFPYLGRVIYFVISSQMAFSFVFEDTYHLRISTWSGAFGDLQFEHFEEPPLNPQLPTPKQGDSCMQFPPKTMTVHWQCQWIEI